MQDGSNSLLWSIVGERTERVFDSALLDEISFLMEYLKSADVHSVGHSRLGAATVLGGWLVDRPTSFGDLPWQGSDQAVGTLIRDLVQLSKIAMLIGNNPGLGVGLNDLPLTFPRD